MSAKRPSDTSHRKHQEISNNSKAKLSILTLHGDNVTTPTTTTFNRISTLLFNTQDTQSVTPHFPATTVNLFKSDTHTPLFGPRLGFLGSKLTFLNFARPRRGAERATGTHRVCVYVSKFRRFGGIKNFNGIFNGLKPPPYYHNCLDRIFYSKRIYKSALFSA